MEWFQIPTNHYSRYYLITAEEITIILQRQSSTPPRSWRFKCFGGNNKNTELWRKTTRNLASRTLVTLQT